MNNKTIIMVASIIATSSQGIALAENTQQQNKQKEGVVNFSQLKVSGEQKQTPLVKALEKPGAYSEVGTENKLQSMDKIIRTMPGTYTQMDASQGTVNVNIRGLSGFGRVNMMVSRKVIMEFPQVNIHMDNSQIMILAL